MSKIVEARLINTRGHGNEAELEIDGVRHVVMATFDFGMDQSPVFGEIFDVELSTALDEDETWEEKFAGNPGHKIGLESTGGWSYRAFGRITSILPVCIDCGILVESRAIYTHDPRVIGEYVAFKINILFADAWRRSN